MDNLKEKIYQDFHTSEADGFVKEFIRLDALKGIHQNLLETDLDGILDGIESYDAAFLVKSTYNSNAIEGSTLSPGDTADVLEGRVLPDKSSKEQYAAKGVADGTDYVNWQLEQNREVTSDFITDVHERTAIELVPRVRGVFRTSPVYLRNYNTVPPDPVKVRGLLDDLLFAYNDSPAHPIFKIAAFHVYFENIHPFIDGNGRTGRLLMNYMLQQNGYAPIAPRYDEAQSYTQALEQWQVYENKQPFLEQIIRSIDEELSTRVDILEKTISMLTSVPDVERPVCLSDRITEATKASHDPTSGLNNHTPGMGNIGRGDG